MTLEAALITAVSALVGAVLFLFRSHIKTLIESAKECKEDRAKLTTRLDAVEKVADAVRSCGSQPCGARDGLRRAETFNLGKP